MAAKNKIEVSKNSNQIEKTTLHPQNPHRFRYDFKKLIYACPDLASFVFVNQFNNETINFANPDAVKMLNKAILKHHYQISHWDIPQNYLCPPIPGRADYIHYIADLLASFNNGTIPKGNAIKVLDIGIGANCIYPIIGTQSYGWQFIGSDINVSSIKSARKIVSSNNVLSGKIECRLQESSSHIFKGIIEVYDFFDVVICNPPFHSSAAEANAGSQRKNKNLGLINKKNLNFGGQNTELWCEGGEEAFIKKMVLESVRFSKQCFWFSTLVAKKEHLAKIYHTLRQEKALEVRTIEMTQGQKISRIVAWTFFDETQQNDWKKKFL